MISKEEFKREVLKWADIIGVNPKEIQIRKMNRKWASCSSKGRLTFSTDLLLQSKEFRNEVIVHELLHLKYPTHNKMFKILLKTYLWKK
ncbi:MAG TPA: M48 family peptidase [Hydrogenothermaceae bacterium]|nr:M48 family peptidase [Hydrogenothermaceae bacterium]HIQ50341.1 M48 family peptidase [Nautiliaceae bacterium]